jgi:predicted dehydrogenase
VLPIYTELHDLLQNTGDLDLVDLITPTSTHYALARQVLSCGISVVVQKPMAQTLSQAIAMVQSARQAGVPLLVHENFRWQRPFVLLKRLIAEQREQLGPLVDLRVEWESGGEDFMAGQPYFAEQPFLVNGEVGVHLIDLLRFLSGRDVALVASAHMHVGVDPRFRGEDIVHVALSLEGGISAAYRAAFSAARKDERPPQTFARLTFRQGAIELGPDYEITVTRLQRQVGRGIRKKVTTIQAQPDAAEWTQDPALQHYQSWLGQWESTLPTNQACADFIRGNTSVLGPATTGEDNLNVLATMFGAYLAWRNGTRIEIPSTMDGLEELAGRLNEARIGYPDFPS